MDRESFSQKERIAALLKTPEKSSCNIGGKRRSLRSKKDEQTEEFIQLQPLKNEVLKTPVKRTDSLDSCYKDKLTPPKRRRGKSLQMTAERTPLMPASENSPLKQQMETPNQKNVQPKSREETKGSDCQKMLEALNVTMITRPVCRETEVENILTFLQVHIKDRQSGSLYITGPPGTGKTACVMHCLRNQKIKKCAAKVHVLNCMAVKTGNAIFKQIAKEFEVNVGRKTSLSLSEALKKYFCKSGPMIVLVMDELDQLESRHQETLYHIFEWATLPSSRLLLIGIANALEPLEHSLPQLQVWKKHKPTLLQFQPYKREEIKAIIEERLQLCKEDSDLILRPEVIEYCSRNAASHNGDVRKALAMLSQAMIVVMNGSNTKNLPEKKHPELTPVKTNNSTNNPPNTERLQVHLHHVQKVMTSVSSSISSLNNTTSQLPLQQKIIVFCLILLLKKSRIREITFGKLRDAYLQSCRKQMVSVVDGGELLSLCSHLEDLGIITMKKKKETHLTKLSLQIDEMDLEPLLKEEKLILNMFNDKTLNSC